MGVDVSMRGRLRHWGRIDQAPSPSLTLSLSPLRLFRSWSLSFYIFLSCSHYFGLFSHSYVYIFHPLARMTHIQHANWGREQVDDLKEDR